MSKPKISVILPVYNAGNYLSQCLNSLINQTLSEIEIVIIIDNPTDGSDKVVEEYARKDQRIIIVRNDENLHIGESRNRGLEIARGKYIAFCDHDDYLDLSMYEKMYTMMEEGKYDLLCSPYIGIIDNKIKYIRKVPSFLSHEELADRLFATIIGIESHLDPMLSFNMVGTVWNKLFRLDIIRENNIFFVDTRIYTAEDKAFLMEYSYRCRRVGKIDDFLYFHILGINNTGASYDYGSVKKTIAYITYVDLFLKKNELAETFKSRFYNSIRLWVFKSLLLIYKTKKISFWSRFIYICVAISDFRKNRLALEAFSLKKETVFNHSNIIKKLLSCVISFFIRFKNSTIV